MKILTWNVNGLRAIHRKGAWDALLELGVDIICLQEIKSEADQLTDEVRSPAGYHGFFNSSKERKGYSGTAIYSKDEPLEVVDDFGDTTQQFDTEGRMQTAYFEDYIVVNCYFPQGRRSQDRLAYKLGYHKRFLDHVEHLRAEYDMPILFCGDVNIAHHPIDLSRPKPNEKTSGFLPVERAWLDQVQEQGWTDVFRHFYPEKAEMYTYWDQITRARDRNVGWRIDYFWVEEQALHNITGVKILTDFMGSDHCPVVVDYDK